MGENATRKSDGQRIKIGTCESMYYLRFDQRGDVDYRWPALSDDVEKLDPFLYRFPDPKEDGTLPGEYESAWGGVKLSIKGFWSTFEPGSVDHGGIQATDTHKLGYLFNLPCPEGNPDLYKGPYGEKPQAHRNGGTTTVTINAQRWYAGHLALVVECAGCQRSIRLAEKTDALPILEALQKEADAQLREAEFYRGSRDTTPEELEQIKGNMVKRAGYWTEIATRILAGYDYAA
jgi:hypothetical protein